jgi:hypothetical protein
MTKLTLNENDIAHLPADVFAGLSQLQELRLNGNALTNGRLPPGVFAGLTGLRILGLLEAGITTLRGDEFTELLALEILDIGGNQLTVLPANFLASLTNLDYLVISENSLSSLPPALLKGLTNLTGLITSDNTKDPLPFQIELEKIGDDGFRARVREGAPFNVVLPLTIEGGTIDGGATSVTVATGTLESATLEVTRTANSKDAVTVDIGDLPDLPTSEFSFGGRKHRGYELVKSAELPLEVIAEADSTVIDLSVDPDSVGERAAASPSP